MVDRFWRGFEVRTEQEEKVKADQATPHQNPLCLQGNLADKKTPPPIAGASWGSCDFKKMKLF